MYDRLKKTAGQSLIYSLGNVATKLIGIVLLPLYTNYLSVSDFGKLAMIEVSLLLLLQVLILGQNQSVIRFQVQADSPEKSAAIVFTLMLFVVSVGGLSSAVIFSMAVPISTWLGQPARFVIVVKLASLVLFFRMLTTMALSVLRANEKSAFFAVVNILKFMTLLVLNLILVGRYRMGLQGIFYGYLASEILLLLTVTPYMLGQCRLSLNFRKLKNAVLFGIPMVFASLAMTALLFCDRYLLKILVDFKEVGLYDFGNRIAGVLNVLFIRSFQMSLLPIAYKIYGQKGDRRYYSKIQTYFVYLLAWVGLALSVYGPEWIALLAQKPDYAAAVPVVTLIALAHVANGARQSVSLGLLLKNHTRILAISTLGSAVVNVLLNLLLIPRFQMIGAAWATVLSFFLLYLWTWFAAYRVFPIPYEHSKLLKILGVSACIYFISGAVHFQSALLVIAVKAVLLMLFPLLLYLWGFYEPVELERIRRLPGAVRLRLASWRRSKR